MRLIIVAALLLPFWGMTQDCKLHRDTDPYTKETKLSSGFMGIPGGSVSIDADAREVDLFFVINEKCFVDGAMVQVFFEGIKAKMTYRNTGSMNCDGYFHIKFRNGASTPSLLQRFSTHKVTQLSFTTSDKKEKVISLSPEEQTQLQQLATCVINEAKTLVK